MLYLDKLKKSTSIYDFAQLLNFKPSALSYLLYELPNEKKYTEFKIPKKSGGDRLIKAPDRRLKLAQRKLAFILNSCVQEIEKIKPRKRPLSHGFKKKIKHDYLTLGIHSNAQCHRNKRYVLNLDLSDFFPSFNFGRVRGFFIKNNHFRLHPDIAKFIAQIACHDNELPQGSPCSPVITNLITHILDVRLTQMAKKYKCTYSRYVDDITLSTNQKIFPEKLAHKSSKFNAWEVGSEIEKIIKRSGFKVNPQKTRLQFRTFRQVVTGLVVNKKVNVKNEYYRNARLMCNTLFNKGEFFLPQDKNNLAKINQLEGILAHIYFTKEYSRTPEALLHRKNSLENVKNKHERVKLDGVSELYSKFLYFRYFIALEKTLIVCEGKTDIIYLKVAIKQLAKNNIYKFPHDINFLPRSIHNDRVSKVMRIASGASALKNFIEFYKKDTKFKFQDRRNPVVVLLDNDHEAQGVVKLISNKNVTYNRHKNFSYYVTSNLYVVLLPTKQNKDNKIEDLFDSLLTTEILNGKTFSDANKKGFDSNIHYSKTKFAQEIVRPQQENIDFTKFKEVLELISEVISHYYLIGIKQVTPEKTPLEPLTLLKT